ncbi:MAG: F0F1 ATP synthase subunit epsilon [Chloroflexi bacterium]|nr:F0F1 ATP synthase subunit epsilon [Chloroflexota bacterium]
MAKLKLEIVTAERSLLSDEVDAVIAPGVVGQFTVLPQHAPLMAMLEPGELCLRKGGDDSFIVVSGGYLEVLDNRVLILADSAERDDEIDLERAEAAKKRAQERLTHPGEEVLDLARAEAALRRSMARLKVAERRKRKDKRLQ